MKKKDEMPFKCDLFYETMDNVIAFPLIFTSVN